MQCNIDQRGRKLRGISGGICSALGIALLVVAWAGLWFWPSLLGGLGLLLAGGFQLFESRKGWCALRAMGIKTPV